MEDILNGTQHLLRKMNSLCSSWERVDTLHARKIDKFRCTVSELGHGFLRKVEISGGH